MSIQTDENKSLADKVADSTIFLSSNYPFDATSKGGSATIIQAPSNKYFIVTAEHVAKSLNKDSYVILHDASGKAVPLKLSASAVSGDWKHHPIADLSGLEIDITKIKAPAHITYISHNNISKQKGSIPRNVKLTVFGYPLFLGVADHSTSSVGKTVEYISPLTYNSFPSSGLFTFPRADTKTDQNFIALENPSTQGYSGGPVFDLKYPREGGANIALEIVEPGLELNGFIHGTQSDSSGGKMTLMTPAYYLWDLIK